MMEPHGEYSDNELIRQTKLGDNAAIKALYDKYIGFLTAVCARYIADEYDRKDVLQESFIKIITYLKSFEPHGEGSLKAWMIRITVNESLRFLKKNSTYSFIENDAALPDIPDEPEPDGIPDNVINDMILSLPPGYRMVFNLYVFENKSHKEIAKILNIGASSSASQFSRARAQLARMIKDYKKSHKNE